MCILSILFFLFFSLAQVIACKREFLDVLDSNDLLNIIKTRKDKICNIKYGDLHFCLKLKKKSIVTTEDIKVKKVSMFSLFLAYVFIVSTY